MRVESGVIDGVKRRIIIDGIKVEGAEAKRIIDEVLYDTHETGQRQWGVPRGLIAGTIIVAGVFSWVAASVVHRLLGGATWPWMAAAGAVTALIVAAVWGRAYLHFHHKELAGAMRERGFDRCPGCGCWLKGLDGDSPRCPECGAAREKSD
jgi:hypothetical protein